MKNARVSPLSAPVPYRLENIKAAMAEVASHRFTLTDLEPSLRLHPQTGKRMRIWEMVLYCKDGSEWCLHIHVAEGGSHGSVQSAVLDWYEEVRLGLSSRRRWKQLRARRPL